LRLKDHFVTIEIGMEKHAKVDENYNAEYRDHQPFVDGVTNE
jgi:hypothetical protein